MLPFLCGMLMFARLALALAVAAALGCGKGSPATSGGQTLDASSPTMGGTGGGRSSGGGSGSGGVNGAGGIDGAGGTNGWGGSSGPKDGGVSADAGSSKGGASAAGASGHDGGTASAPSGLLVDLLSHPENAALTDAAPKFGWIVNAAGTGATQSAYRILVSSTAALVAAGTGDLWDSGKVASSQSIDVPYAGKPLSGKATYVWKVQTWDAAQVASDWSAPQTFVMAGALGAYATATEALVTTHVAPVTATAVGSGHTFFDFGRDAFGWLELTVNAPTAGTVIKVNVGEKASGQSVDLSPGATIRAASSSVTLQQGMHTYRVTVPTDAATMNPPASIGNVMPFRYAEVLNSPVSLTAASASQVAVSYPYDEGASSFSSSNASLDAIWNLSKHTILATTFAGIYIDGDRERKPYEADAYIQQLGHYAVDRQFALARYSHEYLLTHPTWPTEWKQHSIFTAWMDWMYTGNTDSLAHAYSALAGDKLLTQYVGADGLLDTGSICSTSGGSCGPIVDWPDGERDGFVFTAVNTVVNAFYCRNLQQMADIATALGKTADAAKYSSMAAAAIDTFNRKLFNTTTRLYVDGETTSHSSLHANLFPLAFGLVPADRVAGVTAFVKSRGMACSVYGAQYLLEALYASGEADAAMALMTATSLRSWNNMIKSGATMTMEAWDVSLKSNLDWNHAWGAAPANIVGRYVLGVTPAAPGFAVASIRPQLGSALSHADGVVPTIRGPIHVVLDRGTGSGFTNRFTLPANMTANVALPVPAGAACTPVLDGRAAAAKVSGGVSWISAVGSGPHELHCQ
ncbi:MAG TPA: alpha-L-rhamnosidase C-terminal domain-containing protein [Polyangia bacterium]|nr:alpha-L-rhamnosidase C-terminal domain-containing protein [Polyangia bacterium]